MVKADTIKLSNGVEIPLLGYGTWLSDDEESLKNALRAALDTGYRYIDTATFYKNEQFIGDVLQEYYDAGKLKREDVFITTKLPSYGHHQVDDNIAHSLKKLRSNYIDLYLIHTPLPMKRDDKQPDKFENLEIPHIDTWRQLETYYKKGTLKSIGVSNFNTTQLQALYDAAEVKPHNLQNELVELSKKLNILVTAYGSLGSPGSVTVRGNIVGNLLGNELVVELAKKYKKSPAQILLRQTIQRGINVIPKSLNSGRIQENIDVFDFQISDEDMARFSTEITVTKRLFNFAFAKDHPFFPFEQPQ